MSSGLSPLYSPLETPFLISLLPSTSSHSANSLSNALKIRPLLHFLYFPVFFSILSSLFLNNPFLTFSSFFFIPQSKFPFQLFRDSFTLTFPLSPLFSLYLLLLNTPFFLSPLPSTSSHKANVLSNSSNARSCQHFPYLLYSLHSILPVTTPIWITLSFYFHVIPNYKSP